MSARLKQGHEDGRTRAELTHPRTPPLPPVGARPNRLPADLGIKTELLCQEGHGKMWANGVFFEPEPGTVDAVLARHPTEGTRRRILD